MSCLMRPVGLESTALRHNREVVMVVVVSDHKAGGADLALNQLNDCCIRFLKVPWLGLGGARI